MQGQSQRILAGFGLMPARQEDAKRLAAELVPHSTLPCQSGALVSPPSTPSSTSFSLPPSSSPRASCRPHHGPLTAPIVQPDGYAQGLAPRSPNASPRAGSARADCPDIHNRLVADILTRYRALMMLATVQAEGDRNNATPEAVSVAGISMKMEFDGLVRPPPPPFRSHRKTSLRLNALSTPPSRNF